MPDDIVLRSPVTDQELRAFYDPLSLAFSEDLTEQELEAEKPFMERERLINAFDGERRVASSGNFSMELTVPGAMIKAAGITAVGVVPDMRRRGILRQMMDWLLADARAHDESVAILWASEAAIYQRFGFGVGTVVSNFEADRARLVFRDLLPPRDDVRIRMVEADEGARLASVIYDRVRPHIPGALDRPLLQWERMLMPDAEWMRHGAGPKYRAVVEVDGEPRGFVVYRIKDEWSPRGPANQAMVIDLYGLDPEAEQRLWQWICGLDLVGSIGARRGPVPHPMQFWLLEPRRLGLTVGDGMWLRFVDLPAALAGRTYAGGPSSLVVEVADTMFESNAGRWLLTVAADGSARCERTTAAPDLALDVAALACTYLGTYRFAHLAAAGRVRECQPGALQTADVLFTTSRAAYSNTMF